MRDAPSIKSPMIYPALAALLLLWSCTFSSTVKSSSVPLPDEVLEANGLSTRSGEVYLVGSGDSRTFASVVEECRDEVPGSLKASTRRLLVGLKDIKVMSEERRTFLGKPLLVATSSATLDSLPILVKTFSLVRGTCVVDLVFWTQKESFTGTEEAIALNVATWLRDGDAIHN